ncbi:unnamed protein product [Rotaria sp. Silwood1]|nr:unnamed protein product [Rotaria sp. Silwood1]CAF0770193.1 unnamed protein product [Rotaria sp. Silwood1]CAF0780573.1 unnamed protein product [Rotaria sp. Silwood1]CAF3321230.1 unnamed protein product [Rotaria sp. Silwood1]CAF3337336.1 unnamed protein product [Rotaria sp. Silwood1]
MCRERTIDQSQIDNTVTDQYNQLIEQLQNELNELLATTAHLQEESERLEREARKLIDENIQVQIEARLLKEKYRHQRQRQSLSIKRKKRLNFRQLKRQLQRQRQSFLRFERRLRAKYEQPLFQIVSNSTRTVQQRRCRRIRSMPSESID